MNKQILTQSRLQELLHYDPATGIFTWLAQVSAKTTIGKQAGYENKKGYIMVGVDGRCYRAHRLAWLYVTGSWPVNRIDHRDTRRSNNAWRNLREATGAENQQNRKSGSKSKSGLLGVGWDGRKKKWKAAIQVNNVSTHLGRFKTPEEAHAAYVAAKRKLHPFNTL